MDYLQEEQIARVNSDSKGSRVFLFIFVGVVLIILGIIVYLAFISSHRNISDKKLMEGVAMEVGESDSVKFNLDEEEHGMRINFVGYDSVQLTISSEPINLNLSINEIKDVDLNNDGTYDLRIKLVSIIEGKATIVVKRIDKDNCQENWKCSSWESCKKGVQTRVCSDLNSCGTVFYKPSEKRDCLEAEFVYEDDTSNQAINKSINDTLIKNTTNISSTTNLDNLNLSNISISNIINNSLINDSDNSSSLIEEDTGATLPDDSDNADGIQDVNYDSYTNITLPTENNIGNVITYSVCPNGGYPCYESNGFFCPSSYDAYLFNPFCCPDECLMFESIEQFCLVRGYFSFFENETHVCKVRTYSPFNGTNIICCASIELKRDFYSGISTQM